MTDATLTPPLAGSGRRSTRARPTDDQLLDAACAVFAERGFRAATMEQVAAKANSTKPTLYAHFRAKDALYEACLVREASTAQRWLFRRYAEAAQLGLEEQIRADVRAFFDYAAAHPYGFRLLFGAEQDPGADRTRQDPGADRTRQDLWESVTAQLSRLIGSYVAGQGRPAAEWAARIMAEMTSAAVVSGTRSALSADAGNRAAAAELVAAFITAGLGRVDPSRMAAAGSP
ncbi:TetR/AcrR family transcriptional regulator [Rhodococcus sp. D2-41]|uniref:TetR/AcrR family transcriptional regulator n=1 Tax=Speluncibacter jeojiensis TaxID=2710754 RepID=UPI00240FFC00|nr:TetR/AcrR family transcriptional regulator [Rhodococcus sp. D2-41]MDG3011396.1 TetR/AcrR family transcriptional regulator [Rhodococcus sp. D2-41]